MELVFVHGHPFNRSMWRPQVEHFARSNRVIAPDLPGYGDAPVVPGIGFEDFARYVADELEGERVVLVGLSMGGQIVMEFHRLFPERVQALVLVDTSAPAESDKSARYAMADRFDAEGMAPYAYEVLPRMVLPRNEEASKLVLEMMLATNPVGAAAAQRARAERPDYRESLARTEVPALIVVGSEDTYTPVAEAEELHASMRRSTLAVIEGAAHLPNLERPDEFDATLEKFLSTVGTNDV